MFAQSNCGNPLALSIFSVMLWTVHDDFATPEKFFEASLLILFSTF